PLVELGREAMRLRRLRGWSFVVVASVAVEWGAYAGIAAAPARRRRGRAAGLRRTSSGDMPYNAQGKADYLYLLQDINDSKVASLIFDGDLEAGGDGPCSDSLYTNAIACFDSLERPLIWVPGDNDWTDCWGRYGPGTAPYFDPIERLDHERSLFASSSQRFGAKTLTVTRE